MGGDLGTGKQLIQRSFLKQSHVQNLQDCVETEVAVEPFPDDGHEIADGDRDPDLALHGVLRSAGERLDSNELLDLLEEIPLRMAAFSGMMIHDLGEDQIAGLRGESCPGGGIGWRA